MPDKTGGRYNELLERCIDVKKVDIGYEPVDGGIYARRLGPVDILARRHEVRQHLQICEPRARPRWRVAADALIEVSLGIELLCLAQPGFGQAWMLPTQDLKKERPIPLVLPARIGHHPVEVVEHAQDQLIGVALPRR